MSLFDTVAIIDWSGGNDTGPKPKADAIWVGIHRQGGKAEQTYLRNRAATETFLAELFQVERAAGRKVFAGFDFPFGYPQGYGAALTGSEDPLALWDWYARNVTDTPEANNRFDLAGQINLQLGQGKGPFWFNGLARAVPGLAKRKTGYANPFAEKRQCETRAKGAFSCWQMGGAGAVGGQIFTGLPVLARLRRQFNACAWPFEPFDSDIVLVEVWPSLTAGAAPKGWIKDRWQVAEVARQIAALPDEVLADILAVEAPVEGWIFGLGYEDRLRGAPPPLRNDCFALPTGVHWTPVDEALDILRSRMQPVTLKRTLPLDAVCGMVAAEDVRAGRANPPLANTAVDGYGFAGARAAGLHVLPLMQGRAAAGDTATRVPSGSALRILTGAALPEGVDTVVLQEDVVATDGEIRFNGPLRQGVNTRRAGEDVEVGDCVLSAGRRINPADIALLAATGCHHLQVRAPLRVGVLSTGSELVPVGQTAQEGQIHDANRPMLLGLLARWGHEPVDLGAVPDDRHLLRETLDSAAAQVDAILTSGGASAGDEDHISALLTEAGAMSLWRIAIKPGRPLALGMWQGSPVFGLPGNPVAAFVCTLIFARPALAALAGETWSDPLGFEVPSGFTKLKKAGRREFLRARIRNGRAEAFASEGSGRISGLAWAEGLVELPEPAAEVRPGDPVRFVPWASFGI